MLVFDVELLHGTYRADADGSASAGGGGEWPPSPARLFAALIAGDGLGGDNAATTGAEIAQLAGAGPPTIHAAAEPYRQLLEHRYVASADRPGGERLRKSGQHQEYPARLGVLVRPGCRFSVPVPTVRFVYENLDVGDATLAALQYRAARVGYLGCADSPATVTVSRAVPEDPAICGLGVWEPHEDGDVLVNIHETGDNDRWAAAHRRWVETGASRAQAIRYQPKAWYRHPHNRRPDLNTAGRLLPALRFAHPILGRRAVLVAHALKQLVLRRWRAEYGTPPAWLHGHQTDSRHEDYQLARFLVLPNVGAVHSDGRLHAAAIWVPAEVYESEVRQLVVLSRIADRLTLVDNTTILIDRSGARRPRAAQPQRWVGPSRHWSTALPAISDRHGPIAADDPFRWCAQADLPEPEHAEVSRVPLIPGAVSLHPEETRRPGHRQTRRFAHLRLQFAEPLEGPVVIGAARSYGLGLCAPLDHGVEARSGSQQ